MGCARARCSSSARRSALVSSSGRNGLPSEVQRAGRAPSSSRLPWPLISTAGISGARARTTARTSRPPRRGIARSRTSASIASRFALKSSDRLLAVAGFEDAIAAAFERSAREPPDRGFILGEQHAFLAARRRRPGSVPAAFDASRAAGQRIRNCVPRPRLARDLDRGAVRLDDPVDDRQSEPGSLADRLGGEERIEDAFERVRVHAGSRVTDAELEPGRFGCRSLRRGAHRDLDLAARARPRRGR